MNESALIETCNLDKSFMAPGNRRVQVLRQVNLRVAQGERVAVVGTSGAGKTTLMHILGGLDRPTAGEVRFAGRALTSLRDAELDAFRNATIGFVFQFHQLLPEFSALENVMMPLLIGGVERNQARKQAAELMAEVGLEERLSHKPGALSGGEQQRVAIARALVRQPRLLLADEPTGNLDSGTSEAILALLDRLHRSHGLTMIVVSHSQVLAASLDRRVTIEDGVIISEP